MDGHKNVYNFFSFICLSSSIAASHIISIFAMLFFRTMKLNWFHPDRADQMLMLWVFSLDVLCLKLSPNISQVVNHHHKSHIFEQIHLHVAHRQLVQTNIGRKRRSKDPNLMSILTLDFIQRKSSDERWTYKMRKKKNQMKWLVSAECENAQFIHEFFHFDCSPMRMVSLVMDFPFDIHREELLSWQRDIHMKVDEFFSIIVVEVNFRCRAHHIQLRTFEIVIVEGMWTVMIHDEFNKKWYIFCKWNSL